MSEWYDSTPLDWSCSLNQLHATVELVRLGGDPNIVNKAGYDAITNATREKCTIIIEFLNKLNEIKIENKNFIKPNSIIYLGLWKDAMFLCDRAIPIKVENITFGIRSIKHHINLFLEDLKKQPGFTKTGIIAFQYIEKYNPPHSYSPH